MLVLRAMVLRDMAQAQVRTLLTSSSVGSPGVLAHRFLQLPDYQNVPRRFFHRPSNHLRPYSVPRRHYTAQNRLPSTSFPDPSRPDLFYHLLHHSSDAPAFALSFLPTPPPSPDSDTIIGWLPASVEGQEGEAGLNDFVENPKFRSILHEAVQAGIRERVDEVVINGATQLQRGWMHIHDSRNIPALGRIGDPDDILASVLVEDGEIIADTYQAMPSYRFCTADGVIHLTDGLAQKLKSVLEQHASAEANP